MNSTSSGIQILPCDQTERLPQPWGELTWFANRALGNSEAVTVGQCLLFPGQSNPRHFHPNCTEILVVSQGCILHTDAGGGQTEMGVGDTVTIPPNVWHQATNTGTEDAILMIVFTSADRETVGE